MIAPNSRACKGGQKRGEVKGSMEKFERKRISKQTTGEWYNPVSNMLIIEVERGLVTRVRK